MPSPIACAPRLRNAATTREAMLASARKHFARESYDSVGLRDIAGDAGVDPALVSRYFGSKEQLFKEALRPDNALLVEGISRESLPAHLAALLADKMGKDAAVAEAKLDCFMMMLRSASSSKASEIVRQALNDDILEPIGALLGGENATVRASLALAVLMGFGILHSAMAVDPLCNADGEFLRERLTILFAAALAE